MYIFVQHLGLHTIWSLVVMTSPNFLT